MKEPTKAPTVEDTVRPSTESIRRAGTKNIFISVFVAGSSYYSLTLIAKHFGSSLGSDAYFFLSSLSTLAAGLIGSLMGTVFLPAFIKLLSHSDKTEAHRFASSIFSWCLLLSCAFVLPTIIWNEQFFMLASRFDASQISQMHQVLKYFAPIFLLSVLSELFRVIVLSIGKFTTAALTAIFPPFFLIIFLALFSNILQEEALVASLLLAKTVALIMLVYVTLKHGVRVSISLNKNKHTFEFIRTSAPYWSANIITNAATFYFDYQASGFGTGIVSALAYANRIFMLPIVVFLNPIVDISRTKFAQLQVAREYGAFNNYYNKLIVFIVYFSVPLASIYLLFNEEIISALFQRGAFQADSVRIAASCLAIYAWALPLSAVFHVNGRACESFQRLLWPSIFGTLGNLLLIILTFVLTSELNYIGIPTAKVVIEIIYMLPFGFIALQLFGGRPRYGQLIRAVGESVAASILIILIFKMGIVKSYSGLNFSLYALILYICVFIFLYAFSLFFLSGSVRLEMTKLFYGK